MDFILGLGVVVLGMFALSNDDKKNKKVKNSWSEKEKQDQREVLPDPSIGDPSFSSINSSSNNDVKSNINYHIKYIKYKNKYLKEKKNMKGGANVNSPPLANVNSPPLLFESPKKKSRVDSQQSSSFSSPPAKSSSFFFDSPPAKSSSLLISLPLSSQNLKVEHHHKFINGESVEEFIVDLIKIHNLVTFNIIYPICITGSTAIAILLYHLKLFDKLATMNKPSDFDFLFENKNGIGIGEKLNDNFPTLSRKKDINGKMIGNAESSTWKSTESSYTFDLTGIPSESFSKCFKLFLFNFYFNIIGLKSLKSYYDDDIQNLKSSDGDDNQEKLERKKERLKLLNIILETIETNNFEENYGLGKKVSPDNTNRFNLDSPGSPDNTNRFNLDSSGSPDNTNRFNFASSESLLTPVKHSANKKNYTPIKKGNLFDE
jgi:hypothetical protein